MRAAIRMTKSQFARVVGGDFFQILPDTRDGSVLIVAGDVTEHGLQAGMLVALLWGRSARSPIRQTWLEIEQFSGDCEWCRGRMREMRWLFCSTSPAGVDRPAEVSVAFPERKATSRNLRST